jgi:hypothetical protein|tara:strand:+ start:556 stop:2022 length:1467 start_codon:yes stop_codon:yes gene_type:complete
MSKSIPHTQSNLTSKPRYSPSLLNTILVTKTGRAKTSLCNLYNVIEARFRNNMGRKYDGKIVPIRRLHTDALYTSRDELAKKLNKSPDTITRHLSDLENEGTILRDYENKDGSYNKLKIYLLKDTPFFTQPNGIELEQIKELNNHTNSDYIKEKYDIDRTEITPHLKLVKSTDLEGGGIRKNADTNKLREELLLLHNNNYSSLYSNSQNKKNNIYLVENSESEQPLKKSSFENDFYAYADDGEISTYCYDTAGDDMPEYATSDFGLPPKVEPAKEIQPEPTIATKEEDIFMELPEIKQDLRQRLNREICRKFPQKTSENLQESLLITPVSPNKIGLKFNKKIPLKTNEKEQLRKCIKMVYGNNISIVLVGVEPQIKAVPKLQMPTAEDTANHGNTEQIVLNPTRWDRTKDHLLKLYGKDLVNVCLQKLTIMEHEDKVTLRGTDFFATFAKDRLERGFNNSAKEMGLTFVFVGICRNSGGTFINEINGE